MLLVVCFGSTSAHSKVLLLGVRHFQQLTGALEFKIESLSNHLTILLAAKSDGLNYLWVPLKTFMILALCLETSETKYLHLDSIHE